MITTEGLHIGYSKSLLEVEDIQLEAGLHILVGKNGSGKSTFLKTISGQISPVQGSIKLNGKNSTSIHHAEIPKTIAFVGSQFPIVDYLKVSEFIVLGRSPYTNFFGKRSDKDMTIANEAIEALQIDHLKDRYTSELSDGEKQLVSIAKALAQQTPIIALDEPTAFLDYSNKKLVLDQLINISKQFEKCIILSSHDIDLSIEANCPFLVVIEDKKEIQFQEAGISKEDLIKAVF